MCTASLWYASLLHITFPMLTLHIFSQCFPQVKKVGNYLKRQCISVNNSDEVNMCNLSLLFTGNESPQVWCLFTGVHTLCQPEEAHANPQQCKALPVSCLLQELHPETDTQDAYDRSPACETIQMQGLTLTWYFKMQISKFRRHHWISVHIHQCIFAPFSRCVVSHLTECTICWATCIFMLATSLSSVLTAPVSSTWRGTSAGTWRSNTAWMSLQKDEVRLAY